MKPATLSGSAGLLIAHTTRAATPSRQWRTSPSTRRLAGAGNLLGIEVLDHLVLGEAGRFVNLHEQGVLTYPHGPGGELVHVRWDPDGLVCGASPRDLKLEPGDEHGP